MDLVCLNRLEEPGRYQYVIIGPERKIRGRGGDNLLALDVDIPASNYRPAELWANKSISISV